MSSRQHVQERKFYLQLWSLTTGPAVKVMKLFFEVKILNNSTFESFLNDPNNMHILFHQCFPTIPCCKCVTVSLASPKKKGCLNLKQFDMLYDNSGLPHPSHENITGSKVNQNCLCKYSSKRSIKVSGLDITLFNNIIQHCCPSKMNFMWRQSVKDIRNFLAHAGHGKIGKADFESHWKALETATLGFAGEMGDVCEEMFQDEISRILNSSTDQLRDKLKEMLEKSNDDLRNMLDLNRFNPLKATVEECKTRIKLVHQIQEAHDEQLNRTQSSTGQSKDILTQMQLTSEESKLSVQDIPCDIGEVKHRLNYLESLIKVAVVQAIEEEKGKHMDAVNKKITVTSKVDSTSWDEEKTLRNTSNIVKTEIDTRSAHTEKFYVKSLENKYIQLELAALPVVLKNPQTLRKAVKSLINQLVKAGEIDTYIRCKLEIKLTVKTHLTKEELAVVCSVFNNHEMLEESTDTEMDAKLNLFDSISITQISKEESDFLGKYDEKFDKLLNESEENKKKLLKMTSEFREVKHTIDKLETIISIEIENTLDKTKRKESDDENRNIIFTMEVGPSCWDEEHFARNISNIVKPEIENTSLNRNTEFQEKSEKILNETKENKVELREKTSDFEVVKHAVDNLESLYKVDTLEIIAIENTLDNTKRKESDDEKSGKILDETKENTVELREKTSDFREVKHTIDTLESSISIAIEKASDKTKRKELEDENRKITAATGSNPSCYGKNFFRNIPNMVKPEYINRNTELQVHSLFDKSETSEDLTAMEIDVKAKLCSDIPLTYSDKIGPDCFQKSKLGSYVSGTNDFASMQKVEMEITDEGKYEELAVVFSVLNKNETPGEQAEMEIDRKTNVYVDTKLKTDLDSMNKSKFESDILNTDDSTSIQKVEMEITDEDRYDRACHTHKETGGMSSVVSSVFDKRETSEELEEMEIDRKAKIYENILMNQSLDVDSESLNNFNYITDTSETTPIHEVNMLLTDGRRYEEISVDVANMNCMLKLKGLPRNLVETQIEETTVTEDQLFYVEWTMECPHEWNISLIASSINNNSSAFHDEFHVDFVYTNYSKLILQTTTQSNVFGSLSSFEVAVQRFIGNIMNVFNLEPNEPGKLTATVFIMTSTDIKSLKSISGPEKIRKGKLTDIAHTDDLIKKKRKYSSTKKYNNANNPGNMSIKPGPDTAHTDEPVRKKRKHNSINIYKNAKYSHLKARCDLMSQNQQDVGSWFHKLVINCDGQIVNIDSCNRKHICSNNIKGLNGIKSKGPKDMSMHLHSILGNKEKEYEILLVFSTLLKVKNIKPDDWLLKIIEHQHTMACYMLLAYLSGTETEKKDVILPALRMAITKDDPNITNIISWFIIKEYLRSVSFKNDCLLDIWPAVVCNQSNCYTSAFCSKELVIVVDTTQLVENLPITFWDLEVKYLSNTSGKKIRKQENYGSCNKENLIASAECSFPEKFEIDGNLASELFKKHRKLTLICKSKQKMVLKLRSRVFNYFAEEKVSFR